MQIIFWSCTKCLRLEQYASKFLGWLKKFGPAQNIFGPVKGQGINIKTESSFLYVNFLAHSLSMIVKLTSFRYLHKTLKFAAFFSKAEIKTKTNEHGPVT